MPDADTDLNDPEDAYDASDPPGERLRNFARRLEFVLERLGTLDLSNVGDRLARLREDLLALRDGI